MNDHDRQLFEAAWRVPNHLWHTIDPSQAETEAGRRNLENVARHKYHDEEYECGLG